MRSKAKKGWKSVRPFPLVLLLLFFLSLAAGLFFRVLSQAKWDGNRRFTLVFEKSDDQNSSQAYFVIFSIEPRLSRAIYTVLPGNTLLVLPFGYKNYLASSVYKLGELEKKREGGYLLAKGIENTFEIATDGYLIIKDKAITNFPRTPDELKGARRNWLPFLVKGIDTNLSFVDLYRLWQGIKKLRTDQLVFRDLTESGSLVPLVLPDGTETFRVDLDSFALFAQDYFEDTEIRKENLTIEVVNASEKAGQAAHFSQILERLGGHVISKSSAKENVQEACQIFSAAPTSAASAIVKYLQTVYRCLVKKEIVSDSHADIKVILGEEFFQK